MRVSIIPIFFGLLENGDLEDGLHPNASGHQKIFERVKEVLEKKIALEDD